MTRYARKLRTSAPWAAMALGCALLFLVVACGGGGQGDEPLDAQGGPLGPCPPNSGDQQSAGSFIFSNTCTGCHSANLEGDARQGAPPGSDYDTPESILAEAEFIFSRVVDLTMPPPNGLNEAQIEAVRVYITCIGQ